MKIKAKIRKFARGFLARPRELSFMVIGAQKCGTTSLHKYLQRHRRIFGSRPKELQYFNQGVYAGISLDEYKRNFFGNRDGFYFESTPGYLYSPGAAEKIHAAYPDIKLVVVLRDPAKRAYSAWNHYREFFDEGRSELFGQDAGRRPGHLLYEKFYKDRQAFPGFRECLSIELEMIEKNEGFEPALLRRGLYLRQLEEYWRFFDRGQMRVIGFRDLVGNTAACLAEITRFIGAEPMAWDKFDYAPQNDRRYTAPMAEEDARFLAEYYRRPNEDLFEVIGAVNW